MATRLELVEAISERRRSSGPAEKRQILDEFAAVTGYHRKHAIRLLRSRAAAQALWVMWSRSANVHTGQRRHGEASKAGQMEASDYVTNSLFNPHLR